MERDRKRLNRLVKRASSVLASAQGLIEEMGEKRMLAKPMSMMGNTRPPLHETVETTSTPSAADCYSHCVGGSAIIRPSS